MDSLPPAVHLHPLGGESPKPVELHTPASRLNCLTALATMTRTAFDLVLRQASVNPMPVGAITDADRITLSAFYHGARDYFKEDSK